MQTSNSSTYGWCMHAFRRKRPRRGIATARVVKQKRFQEHGAPSIKKVPCTSTKQPRFDVCVGLLCIGFVLAHPAEQASRILPHGMFRVLVGVHRGSTRLFHRRTSERCFNTSRIQVGDKLMYYSVPGGFAWFRPVRTGGSRLALVALPVVGTAAPAPRILEARSTNRAHEIAEEGHPFGLSRLGYSGHWSRVLTAFAARSIFFDPTQSR